MSGDSSQRRYGKVQNMGSKKTAEDLSFEALDANGTPRQIALARSQAILAYLQETIDDLSHPPARPLPDDEPHQYLNEVAELWERFCALRFKPVESPAPRSPVDCMELVDDVALEIPFVPAELEEWEQRYQTGDTSSGIPPSRPDLVLKDGLGAMLRERLRARGFVQPTMSDRDMGEAVILWRRTRGSINATGAKWRLALQLVREAGCECHSDEALRKVWDRRLFRRVSPEEAAAALVELWRGGALAQGYAFEESEAQRSAEKIYRVDPKVKSTGQTPDKPLD